MSAAEFEGYRSPSWYLRTQARVEKAPLEEDVGHRTCAEQFFGWLTWRGVNRVLDVGCAEGWAMEAMRNRYKVDACGVDNC